MMKQIVKVGFLLLILLLVACDVATETAVSPEENRVNDDVQAEATVVGNETSVVETTATSPQINLPDLGIAPEITNDIWINSDAPITLASQQGKVVLLEFWTFG